MALRIRRRGPRALLPAPPEGPGRRIRGSHVLAVGGPQPRDPVRGRGLDRIAVGWAGADVPAASCDLEREFDLPYVRAPELRDDRSEPQSVDDRPAGAGRGLAQQPSRLPALP